MTSYLQSTNYGVQLHERGMEGITEAHTTKQSEYDKVLNAE